MGSSIEAKFDKLATDHAPGQETRQKAGNIAPLLRGERIDGVAVDFSHGDVDAFVPAPRSFEAFGAGVERGGSQAYTEYRGSAEIRERLAARLAGFTGTPVSAEQGLILTNGSQGALFLAVASTVAAGDKVAIVQPDYFANRKLVEFCDGEIVPVRLDYLGARGRAGLDLAGLEQAFAAGAIISGALANDRPPPAAYGNAHVNWCSQRYRSYRAYDNTWQPYNGPRRQCVSPY